MLHYRAFDISLSGPLYSNGMAFQIIVWSNYNFNSHPTEQIKAAIVIKM